MSEETDEVPGLAGAAPPRKRRVVTSRRKSDPETGAEPAHASNGNDDGGRDDPPSGDDDAGKQSTMEELDLRDMLPSNPMKPAENVKSLGDVIAKYNIGGNPEFKLQVWRTYPKIFPGGVKADGFYDTWDQPLTEELIQSEYGGGNFRVVVMGPHPTKPNTLKHFDSVSLNLAGTPKYDRQPKAVQQSQTAALDAAPPSPLMMGGGQENAKLSETAMKLAVDMAGEERKERIRIEERAEARADRAAESVLPAVEAERRRADDLIRAERERSETERKHMQERFDESRSETRRLVERIEQMEANRPSMASEMKEIMSFMPRPDSGEGNKVAERMMESVLEKHRIEMEAMRAGHQQMLDNMSKQHEGMTSSMRASHLHEITSMRESHQRDLQMEREAGTRRQERADDQLRMEREERARDQQRAREVLDANDRTWKERIEMQLASANQSWESRHQSVVATYENRGLWLQQEIDRLKSDLSDTRARMSDNSDPIAIVHKAKEIREAIGGPEQSGGGSGGGGGIGMGGAEDWKNLAVEGLTERAPQLLQVLGGLLSGQQAQQQPQQYQVGQTVQTPQGEMVVVQTPQGLALTPKAALEQAAAQQQGRMLPQQGGGQRRQRVMPDAEEVANAGNGRRKRRGPVSAVPNFADPSAYGSDPLPVRGRRPPWEGGGADEGDDEPRQQRPQQPPQGQPQAQRRTSKPDQQAQQAQPAQQRIARQMTPQERQGLSVIAKIVHESVMNADEPEEFAEKVIREWTPEMLKRVISGYSPDDIARGIMETQPSSAGATPAGQAFVRDAFARIEQAVNG